MMSLEEFYSAIADAYSVAKGERSHYTKEEVTEKLNRQLKSRDLGRGRNFSEEIGAEIVKEWTNCRRSYDSSPF